jgi:two-component system chemotaxis response regulator CheB
MKLRVVLAVKASFTAIALRAGIRECADAQLLGEARTSLDALRVLRSHPQAIAIVDIDLFSDPDSEELQNFLQQRQDPFLLVNAKGTFVPPALTQKPFVSILESRHSGELDLAHIQAQLIPALRAMREAWVNSEPLARGDRVTSRCPTPSSVPSKSSNSLSLPSRRSSADLVVIGVSTGGPTLLLKMLRELQTPTVPTLIVQHMPASETAGFAARLAEEIKQSVVETGVGALPAIGTIGLVQGGKDFALVRNPNGTMRLKEVELPHNPFHPSVDSILLSAAEADIAAFTVILTGMGQDGAVGALALMRRGCPVIAQSPDTCAVAGMPQAAIQNGAAQAVQSPERIVESVNRWYSAKQPSVMEGSSL